MINKKGFTLIEMICVFALLGIIGTSMTLGIRGIIKSRKNNEANENNENNITEKASSRIDAAIEDSE